MSFVSILSVRSFEFVVLLSQCLLCCWVCCVGWVFVSLVIVVSVVLAAEFVVSVDLLWAVGLLRSVVSAFVILHVLERLWKHISKLHLMAESTSIWHKEKPNKSILLNPKT